MLIVGTDSYVTVTEADGYIDRNYRSNNPDRKRWQEISDEDKEVLLRQACKEIDALPFKGRKATIKQPLAFPRLPFQYCSAVDVPANVKSAQIELALWLSDDEKQAEISQRQSLQTQGITAVSIGSTSESYGKHNGNHSVANLCIPVKTLLYSWLNGGYEVR